MAFRPYDLTDLLTAQPEGPSLPIRYRQGTVTAWNPITLQNTVLVGGALMQDLPVLGVAEAASFRPGVKVGIAVVEGDGVSTWAILGRFVIPNTADATDAITQLGQRSKTDSIPTQESTANVGFVDLATVGPRIIDVLIPASGKATVTISAEISAPVIGKIGIAVTGATTIAANSARALADYGSNPGLNASKVLLFEGLPPGGLCTFTCKYASDGANNAFFQSRELIVETR